MHPKNKTQYQAQRTAAEIERERRELSDALARVLSGGDAQVRRHSPWELTMPAGLDMPRPSQPFEEPLRGMSMREVPEPHVFRHYFEYE